MLLPGGTSIKTKICIVLASEPAVITPLVDQLAAAGLITDATEQAVKFMDRSPYDKAEAMIGPALGRIRDDPCLANSLLTALEKVGLQNLTSKPQLIEFGE